MKTSSNVKKLALQKLNASGLDLTDADQLDIKYIDGSDAVDLGAKHAVPCLLIPYYDPAGQVMSDWHNCDPFYRLRYLQKPKSQFGENEKKVARYIQPPSSVPVAYYPKNYNWMDVLLNFNEPLIITEGELKAAKACKDGFPAIGIGGVYAWRAARVGLNIIPSLEFVEWRRRRIYLVFDSDYRTNPLVSSALRDFAKELEYRGAYVYLVSLPPLDQTSKTGLDDFLVASKPKQFEELLDNAEPLGCTEALYAMNDNYMVVNNPGFVYDIKNKTKYSIKSFQMVYSSETAVNYELKPNGAHRISRINSAHAWLKWPQRREVDKLIYAPGRPNAMSLQRHEHNIWPGWGVEPQRGNHAPFLDLINHLFIGADKEDKQWFLKWLAYPLQYPGTKLYTSVCLFGLRHGTGKSLVGYTMGKIYGDNFTEISQGDLRSAFNEWAEGKQFVLGDDVTGSDKRTYADKLKKLITQHEVRINAKFVSTYTTDDCINYLFTSNQPDAFFLEDDDRRYFIHEVTAGPLEESFYVDYDLWLDSGGPSALFDYLLHVDVSDFNPAGPARKTRAKEQMTTHAKSDLGEWVSNLMRMPDYILRIGNVQLKRDLYTSRELLNLYDPAGRATANGMARELRRAGFVHVLNGAQVKLRNGSQYQYFIVRNYDKWVKAKRATVIKHIEQNQ